jgi:hypothetical protein
MVKSVRLALSDKLKLPCIKIGSSKALPLYKILWLLKQQFKVKENGDIIYIYRNDFHFITKWVNPFFNMMNWDQDYILPKRKVDKIFDVGCDFGSSMIYFYFAHGIKTFSICDLSKTMIKFCKINAKLNDWSIEESFCKPYSNDMIRTIEFDLMKMDIEGYERELLLLKEIDFPVVLEVHGKKLRDAFESRGFKAHVTKHEGRKGSDFDGLYIMNNYSYLGVD